MVEIQGFFYKRSGTAVLLYDSFGGCTCIGRDFDDGKIILLKTYFSQGELQPFYYSLDAFKLSLLRNKQAASNYQTAISNFLIQFKKIAKLLEIKGVTDDKSFKIKQNKVEKRLANIQPIYCRGWLLKELGKVSVVLFFLCLFL